MATEVKVSTGSARGVCKATLSAVKTQLGNPDYPAANALAAKIEWKPTSYKIEDGRGELHTMTVNVTHFDIDNDGKAETIWKRSTLLRSETAEVINVFEGDYLPDPERGNPFGDGADRAGIDSVGNGPYMTYGFTLGTLSLMSYGGRNYVLMEDAQFGRRIGRSILVAEYRGRPKIDKEYSSMDNAPTDDIKVVCKVTQVK